MKICYVGNIDVIHTQRWAKAFAKLGHEVHVAYSSANPSSALEMRKAGVLVHYLSRHVPQTSPEDDKSLAREKYPSVSSTLKRRIETR